ncbi:MAG: hypothetical protein RLZZ324_1242 [Candidatus Parcubacteria bacterium]|jgi:hypothetical protein
MSSNTTVADLFADAQDQGTLSPAAAQVLDIPDMGAQIQLGLGISVDDVEASEVVLVTELIDDSGSIRFITGNTEAVRAGHNLVLDALGKSKQSAAIITHTKYLNGHVLFPYVALANAVKMDASNYDPRGGTPLYDQTLVTLGTVLAKAQEFVGNGVHCRTVTLIVTDGADQGSRATVRDVAKVVKDLLRAECHIVAGMGIDDGVTDFKKVFTDMGIPAEWQLTSNSDPSSIRKAFQVFSQSAVRASQSAASFSKAALGGFGNP